MNPSYYVVLITTSGSREADKVSRTIVREKLAACVNIVPKIKSVYWWKNKVETAGEALLIVKTGKNKLNPLIRRVSEIHSYKVPETIALPIFRGNPDYLGWIKDSIGV